jgi:hypothetical protein
MEWGYFYPRLPFSTNQRTSGNGAIAFLFYVGHLRPAVERALVSAGLLQGRTVDISAGREKQHMR